MDSSTLHKKIAISGWPGAGSTTLSLILADALKLPLLQGSEVFRLLIKTYANSNLSAGAEFSKVDDVIGSYFDHLYDEYIDFKLLQPGRFILVSDIAAFRLGRHNTYVSVFLAVDQEERKSRMVVDGREDDKDNLENRDQSLASRYNDLYNIDIFDEKEIAEKYSLVIDTTNRKISEELIDVYTFLKSENMISESEFETFTSKAEENEANFWEHGKDWYTQRLKNDKLLIDGQGVLEDINAHFPEKVAAIPEPLKSVIASLL